PVGQGGEKIRRLGMPAGRRAHPPGHGAHRPRHDSRHHPAASDGDPGPRLRHRGLKGLRGPKGLRGLGHMSKREITRADILPMDVYGSERSQRRKVLVEVKRRRRLSVGPYATFLFENYETMWMQIHEMLFIEKGGEA